MEFSSGSFDNHLLKLFGNQWVEVNNSGVTDGR